MLKTLEDVSSKAQIEKANHMAQVKNLDKENKD
jgi:hypothetical protein